MDTFNCTIPSPITLESGVQLPIQIEYSVVGTPKNDGANVVFVCPPLTANSCVTKWWSRLFGSGKFFDPDRYSILCPAPLGSAYGTTGPWTTSRDKASLGHKFPNITVRDIARANLALIDYLGYSNIRLLVGASLGGEVSLEMCIMRGNLFNSMLLLACATKQSQYRAAHNETQRQIIELDPSSDHSEQSAGMGGLAIARAAAVLSYRPFSAYEKTQKGYDDETGKHKAIFYQHYKGKELAERFNSISYNRLLNAQDCHDIGRDRGGVKAVLSSISSHVHMIAFTGDPIYSLGEQKLIADGVPDGTFDLVSTDFGHDAFLIESTQITDLLNRYQI
ncbi:MAG: homoserine O-acetyltransferase [Planctomycetota bacterium]